MTRYVKASSAYSSDKIDCPEKRLFVAVLSQAVHDAFSEHVSEIEKMRAQSWLMSNSCDFKTICECAGRNSSYVLEKIRRKILEKNGWNVNVSLRTQPRRRRQMRKINKKHLTGNSYYAAKKREQTKIA
jgi:hypothetical protein|tara:strand:- start:938 stop:1324 length:387 start_codon:yes stop_codon:yes gene_type:complete